MTTFSPPRPALVLPIDVPSMEEARLLVDRLHTSIDMMKVGLELFIQAGPAAVRLGEEFRLPVFLDLKLHDIPETVEHAVARVSDTGARVVTVHAAGGRPMLRRAVMRAERDGAGLAVAAVTILTSFNEDELGRIGLTGNISEHVLRLAELAHGEGVRHFVCSPHEAPLLRTAFGNDAILITPGVRALSSVANDDQKRVMTPAAAIQGGADWLVVGRPIREAADPVATARTFKAEMRSAFSSRS